MAISPQRLTIYLYSAYRAVIFAIAQLSCNVIALRNEQVSDHFQLEVSNRFAALASDQPTSWETFRDTLQTAASQLLGTKPPSEKGLDQCCHQGVG